MGVDGNCIRGHTTGVFGNFEAIPQKWMSPASCHICIPGKAVVRCSSSEFLANRFPGANCANRYTRASCARSSGGTRLHDPECQPVHTCELRLVKGKRSPDDLKGANRYTRASCARFAISSAMRRICANRYTRASCAQVLRPGVHGGPVPTGTHVRAAPPPDVIPCPGCT